MCAKFRLSPSALCPAYTGLAQMLNCVKRENIHKTIPISALSWNNNRSLVGWNATKLLAVSGTTIIRIRIPGKIRRSPPNFFGFSLLYLTKAISSHLATTIYNYLTYSLLDRLSKFSGYAKFSVTRVGTNPNQSIKARCEKTKKFSLKRLIMRTKEAEMIDNLGLS